MITDFVNRRGIVDLCRSKDCKTTSCQSFWSEKNPTARPESNQTRAACLFTRGTTLIFESVSWLGITSLLHLSWNTIFHNCNHATVHPVANDAKSELKGYSLSSVCGAERMELCLRLTSSTLSWILSIFSRISSTSWKNSSIFEPSTWTISSPPSSSSFWDCKR